MMVVAIRSTTVAAFASRAGADEAIRGLLAAAFKPAQIVIVLPKGMAAAGELEPDRDMGQRHVSLADRS